MAQSKGMMFEEQKGNNAKASLRSVLGILANRLPRASAGRPSNNAKCSVDWSPRQQGLASRQMCLGLRGNAGRERKGVGA